MKNRDLISSLFFIGFGIIFFIGALQHGVMSSGTPGSGCLPFIAGIILISLSTMILIPAIFNRKEESGATEGENFFPQKDSLGKIFVTICTLFGYAFFLRYLGYLLTTFLFTIGLLKFVEPGKWKITLIFAFLAALLSFTIFAVLKIELPKGILGI